MTGKTNAVASNILHSLLTMRVYTIGKFDLLSLGALLVMATNPAIATDEIIDLTEGFLKRTLTPTKE
jgi:hypothetical protein